MKISRTQISRMRNAARYLLAAGVIAHCACWSFAKPTSNAPKTQEYQSRLSAARDAYFKVVAGGESSADEQAHAALAAFEQAFPGDARGLAYHGSLQLLDVAHSWQIWNLHKQVADGLIMIDTAVAQAPDEPEVRFVRAATDWHLPGFYHRHAQSETDFAILAAHAEEDAKLGKLPPQLAAASLSYWGQILIGRKDHDGARAAFAAAIRVAPQSPAGLDAQQRLSELQ